MASVDEPTDITTSIVQYQCGLCKAEAPTVEEITQHYLGAHVHAKWTTSAAKLLINLRGEFQSSFLHPVTKKIKVWEQISAKMLENGYYFVAEACDKKWRNMLCTYRRILEKRKAGNFNTKWELFEDMSTIFPENSVNDWSEDMAFDQEDDNLSQTSHNDDSCSSPVHFSVEEPAFSIPEGSFEDTLADNQPSTSGIFVAECVESKTDNISLENKKSTEFRMHQNASPTQSKRKRILSNLQKRKLIKKARIRLNKQVAPYWFIRYLDQRKRQEEQNWREYMTLMNQRTQVLTDLLKELKNYKKT